MADDKRVVETVFVLNDFELVSDRVMIVVPAGGTRYLRWSFQRVREILIHLGECRRDQLVLLNPKPPFFADVG
jgi:hypothetical protein